MGSDTEILIELYRRMLMVRRVEERLAALFADGEIPGFIHLGIVKGEIDEPPSSVAIGSGRIAREGTDVTIVSYGAAVAVCIDAAQQLAADRIAAEVINLRSLQPWDLDLVLTSLAKTHRVVIVHKAVEAFGVGAGDRRTACRRRVRRVGWADRARRSAVYAGPFRARLSGNTRPVANEFSRRCAALWNEDQHR